MGLWRCGDARHNALVIEAARQTREPCAISLYRGNFCFLQALQKLAHAGIPPRWIEPYLLHGLRRGFEMHTHGVKAINHAGLRK